MKVSIYSSAFNVVKNKYPYLSTIFRFCSFADEVVVSVNTSEDQTFYVLKDLQKDFDNLKIIESNFSYEDPFLDGKIKNNALQNCTGDVLIGLDMDEYIPNWQKPLWDKFAEYLLEDSEVDCFMFPSLNLYKDIEGFCSITNKWYLHKKGLFRGPVNFGKTEDGFLDISKSDGCELIDKDGNLAKSKSVASEDLKSNNVPFVVHTGYLNLQDKVLRAKNFWNNHWNLSSGGKEGQIFESEDDIKLEYRKHNLNIL